jgi:UDP-3-O-[3-hydroxymyristoyl] N-acetylglucosamine deacetylase
MKQHTIQKSISVKGIGLHSGLPVNMRLFPAPANTGIVFVRVDKDPLTFIKAENGAVQKTQMSTDLCKNDINVRTIEHLMSALATLKIDNVYVELDNEEVPILDGSSAPFCFLIKAAGISKQFAPRKYLKINETIRVGDSNAWAEIIPYDGFALDFTIDFSHPLIGCSSFSTDFSDRNFESEISRARTFGFLKDVETLKKNGLALGASIRNAIVLNDYNTINPEGLRYDNEFVRHKILDAVGDLYASGYQILGRYRGYKAGHRVNYELVKAILESEKTSVYCHQSSESIIPTVYAKKVLKTY